MFHICNERNEEEMLTDDSGADPELLLGGAPIPRGTPTQYFCRIF